MSECRSLPLRVWAVTNIHDAGSGSLRAIIEKETSSSTFDIVVFRVGGTIELRDRIRRDRLSCLYIAGQTAPGDGIQLTAAGPSKNLPIQILSGGADSEHWVIRYLRIRGDNSDATGAQGANFAAGGLRYAVLDHLSTCCSDDKELSIDQSPEGGGRTFGYITLSNSIVYAPRGTGLNIHGDTDMPGEGVSVIRNLLGGRGWRWPRYAQVRNGQVVNNIIYGWESDGVRVASALPAENRLALEWIRNYHKPFGSSDRFGSVEATQESAGIPRFRAVGNVHSFIAPGPHADQTQWRFRFDRTGPVPDSAFTTEPVLRPRPRFDANGGWEALDLPELLLPTVGAYQRLTCDGSWRATRDRLDATFVAEVRDSTWIGGSGAAAYGGLPILEGSAPCADSDADGLPDEWETRWMLNPTHSGDAAGDADSDGYLNIEEYLNGTDPHRAEP